MPNNKKAETRGEKVIRFIETFCRVPSGALVNKPLRLADFQKRFILEIYDNPHGTRRAFLSIARKNGKTGLIAAILLAHLVGPEAKLNAQIVSGATSREQAGIVFDLACKMIGLNPELAKVCRIVPSSKRIVGLSLNTEFRALAADGSRAQGLSPILAILDEVGQVRGPQNDFIDAITTSQGAHENPLLIAISTQAPTDADLFSIWLDDAERSGDPTIVSHCYAAPDDCEITDEAAWRAANPALGIFNSEKFLASEAAQAVRMPSKENAFRNLNLNQRVNVFSPFVSPAVWKAGNAEPPEFGDALVFGGLDLSKTTDLTAFVLAARIEGKLAVRAWFWTPELRIADNAKRDRAPYLEWHRKGLLRTTPGQVVDYAHVAAEIVEICSGLNVAGIAFDRFRMDRLTPYLEATGANLPLEPFGQGYASMSPAIEALEEDLLQERVLHGGNPVLAMCAANAVSIQDPAGNRKLDKAKSTGRIDGIVALAMACGIENKASAAPVSPWEDPNFSLAALNGFAAS